MCRHCQYTKTAHNSRFIKDAKSRCKYILCGRWMLGVIKQVRYDCRSAALGSLLYSNDDEKARHAQDAWMWQLTSTPFQDTAGCTTCLTSLPQSSRAEHAALTVLQPSTAPWKALGAFLGTTLVRRMDSLQDTVLKLIDRYTKKGIRV